MLVIRLFLSVDFVAITAKVGSYLALRTQIPDHQSHDIAVNTKTSWNHFFL